jgi:predicted TIM-barrel fold metal-dependent hydrolase
VLPQDADVISVDDHVVEPPNVWVDRFPARLREQAPHIEDRTDHTQTWVWEGQDFPLSLMGSPRTRVFRTDGSGEDFRARHYDDMVPACYDVKARVEAMDTDGVKAQLLFPTFPRFGGTQFKSPKDPEISLLAIQAYNDWMLDEWCAAFPDRFIPMVIVPLWDPEAAAAEILRTAGKGAKSVTFPENPAPLGLPSYWTRHWDPLFAAAQETGMPLSLHIGTSGGLVQPAPESSEAVGISLCGVNSMSACTDLIFSGVLHRHPGVKIALSEGGSGWVPYLLERMDYTWERTRLDVERSDRPSHVFQRHFWTCFISDFTAIELRHRIGVDKLMYETDYPHNDSNWPHGRKVLEEHLVDVPEGEARMIAGVNARALYDFHA